MTALRVEFALSASNQPPAYWGRCRVMNVEGADVCVLATGPFSEEAIASLISTEPLSADDIISAASQRVEAAIDACDEDDMRPYCPTSMAVAILKSHILTISWVGLCYAAVLREGTVLWNSRLHTLQQELAETDHPRKSDPGYANVVSRSLGHGFGPGPESVRCEAHKNDIIILCSSPLVESVGLSELARLLESPALIPTLHDQCRTRLSESVLKQMSYLVAYLTH